MKAFGIVAEFDPLHNGHKYILSQARLLGAEAVAVVMSGSAVQRGRLAVWDKYSRAQAAVRQGADIVFELPAPLSCSNAQVFARSAVGILAALGEGVVDSLVFGSEVDDIESVKAAARVSDELSDSIEVKRLLAQGKSYPAALSIAAGQYGEGAALAMQNPNSILGVEYCRALSELAPWCEPQLVRRVPPAERADILSATEIRSLMQQGRDYSAYVPEALSDPCDMRRLDRQLLFALLTAEKPDFLALPDVDEPLADRFIKAQRSQPQTAGEFLELVKAKNYTHARLRRTALYLALGVRKADILPPRYIRPLAFNDTGARLLSEAKPTLPLSTSLAGLSGSSDEARHLAYIENKASVLRALGTEKGIVSSDYKAQIKKS